MVRTLRLAVLAAVTFPALLVTANTSAAASPSSAGSFTDAVVAHPFASAVASSSTEALPRVQASTGTAANARLQRSGASLVARPQLGPRSTDTTTSNWSYAGVDGNVKVGIIDFFDAATLTSEINGHEVSPVPNSRRKCLRNGAACAFGKSGSKHGNAMAEIIGDQAPGVVLYLAEADTLRDYRTIIDWFAANGVKIVNHSLIGNFDGPGNGTGPQADIVNYAVTKGMAWFNSAGDMGVDSTYSLYAGSRWSGKWSDPDKNGWLNFKGTDETLGAYCGALLGLRWSDWGAGRTDYQLWINDVTIRTRVNGTAVLASDRNQAAGAAPLEANDFRWLCNTNPALGPVYDKNTDGFVALKVKRSTRSTAASSTGDVIEIQVNNGFLEYSTDAGSVRVGFADARSAGAATIGHMAQAASHGPTADARIKPDLITNGCSPTLAYGDCFTQTSYDSSDTATAKATGVAAMALDGLPTMSPAQLVQYMRNSANEDLRVQSSPQVAALPNNTEGWGTVELQGVPQPPTHPPARFLPHDERLIDTRKPNSIRKGIAVVPRTGTIVMRVPPWGQGGDASGGTAVLNITTLGTLGAGFVQVGPTGSTVPGAYSNLTVEKAGQTLSTMVFVPVGIDGKLTLYTTAGGHFIIDYLGAFEPQPTYNPTAVPAGFLPVDPFRAYDSQCGGCAGPMTPGSTRDITVAGTGSPTDGWKAVPATGVTAVAVSITAESPAGTGHVSVVSTADAPPANTMTLQVTAGRTATGTTIVPVDADGRIRLWSTVTTPVQVDILGYFATDAPGLFTPVAGVRALDTRNAGPVAPSAGTVSTVDLAPFGVPADASGVVGSVGIAAPTGAGGLQVGRTAGALVDTYRNVSVSAAGQGVVTGLVSAVDQSHLSITTSTDAHRTLFVTGWFSAIARATAGATTVVPMDPATPSDTITTFVASTNGQHLLIGHRTGAGSATISLYHRGVVAPANPYQALDLTVGPGVPNADVVPLGVSSDGRRVLFSSDATNITVGSNGTIYEIDLDGTGLPRQVDRQTDGTHEFGARFDPELTHMGYVIFDGTANLYRFLVKPIAPGSPTTEQFSSFAPPNANADFTAALVGDLTIGPSVWRLGQPATIPHAGNWSAAQFSPDGRYMVDLLTVSATGTDTRLWDLDTGTTTVLCRDTSFTLRVPLFDWSGGPPVAGSFCQSVHPFFDVVVSSGGTADAVPTWTGLHPRNGTGLASASKLVAAGGVVMALTDASNLVPGVAPTSPQIFIWDNPQL